MRFTKLTLAGMVIIALGIVGCNENNNPVNPPVTPNAPTGLMATSRNSTTVGLKWAAPATGAVPTSYTVSYTMGSMPMTQDVSTGTSVDITGLTEGTMYSFTVKANNGTASSVASDTVMWAPAKRLTGTYKLYSSKSSTNGSGLSFSLASVLKIDQGDKWDICFDDKDGKSLVGSPGVSGYVDNNYSFPNGKSAKIVAIGRDYLGVNTLDDVYDVQALNVAPSAGFQENLKDLSTVPDQTKGYGFVVRSKVDAQNVNFAKVLVKSSGTGFVQGTGNDKYIEVEVSYQTLPNVPYALVAPLDRIEKDRVARQQITR